MLRELTKSDSYLLTLNSFFIGSGKTLDSLIVTVLLLSTTKRKLSSTTP